MDAMDARNMSSNLAVNKYLHTAASHWISSTYFGHNFHPPKVTFSICSLVCFSLEYVPIFTIRSQLVNSAVHKKFSWNPAPASKPKLTNQTGKILVFHTQFYRDLSQIGTFGIHFETDLKVPRNFPTGSTVPSENCRMLHSQQQYCQSITNIPTNKCT